MIKDGYNGFLYTNENLPKALDSIIELYNNKSLAEKFGKRARKDYFEIFSKEKHIKRALDTFNKI